MHFMKILYLIGILLIFTQKSFAQFEIPKGFQYDTVAYNGNPLDVGREAHFVNGIYKLSWLSMGNLDFGDTPPEILKHELTFSFNNKTPLKMKNGMYYLKEKQPDGYFYFTLFDPKKQCINVVKSAKDDELFIAYSKWVTEYVEVHRNF